MEAKEITVVPAEEGMRLDAFLLARFPALSRKSCALLLAGGGARVGGRRARKGDRLSAGDVVTLDEESLAGAARDFVPSPAAGAPAVTLLHEDDEVAAADKPCGVDCAPLGPADGATLLGGVLARFPAMGAVKGWRSREPGLLYRLDRDVSGVVLFALTQRAFDALHADSEGGLVRKTYLAVVEKGAGRIGRVPGMLVCRGPRVKKRSGLVDFESVEFREGEHPAAAADGKEYAVRVTTLAAAPDALLLELEIARAMRHQIRGALAAAGCPVAGDARYGSSLPPRGGGILLHCRKVSFRRPADGRRVVVVSPAGRIVSSRPQFKSA